MFTRPVFDQGAYIFSFGNYPLESICGIIAPLFIAVVTEKYDPPLFGKFIQDVTVPNCLIQMLFSSKYAKISHNV